MLTCVNRVGVNLLSAREMTPPEQSDMSEYEKQRLQNIRENKAKLAALGIPDAKPTPKAKRKAPVYTPTVTEPARKTPRSGLQPAPLQPRPWYGRGG